MLLEASDFKIKKESGASSAKKKRRTTPAHSFPRSPWECRLRRSASLNLRPKRTQSVKDGIPTRSVGTSVTSLNIVQ
jgi:hypothetical protein